MPLIRFALIYMGLIALLSFQTGCGGQFASSHSSASKETTSVPTPSPFPPPPPGSPSAMAMTSPSPALSEREIFNGMPQGAASLTTLCGLNTGSDKFTNVFCAPNPPAITSLASLTAALGLTNNANVACTTASGSLSKKETSVLTPRCIRFSLAGYDPNATALAYVRSAKTFVEIVSQDPVQGLRFYLVKFDLACEASGSCNPADYMQQSAESNWQNVSFYEDKQLKNTPMDCTSCHQPKGPSSQKHLLMIETQDPWSHWFHPNRPCGKTLYQDYASARNVEAAYMGLSTLEVANSDPGKLQAFVENNGSFGAQFGNNIYSSSQILYDTGLTAGQPENNATPGVSPTWQSLYDQRVTGANRLAFGGTALPYHDCKQSDPAKLPGLVANFKGVVAGTIPKAQSLDLSAVNLSTPEALSKRFLTTAPGHTTAQQIMANACVSCHNNNLDQSISRAGFNAQDLTKNSAYMYGVAMGRIKRGAHDMRKMPPANFMELKTNEIQILLDFFASQGGK